MPELDSIRGIAVLMVLFYHGFASQYGTGWFSGGFPKLMVILCSFGWAGVNVFFVLSGFLITGILLDSKSRPGYYRRFYVRRALRILPAYYAVLILLALLGSFVWLNDERTSWKFLGLSVVYLANVTVLFGVPMQYPVLWSLAVEEHFYFIWPLVVRRLSRSALIAIAGSIIVATAVARVLIYRAGHFDLYHQFFTWLAADALAMGSVLAALLRSRVGTRAGLTKMAVAAFGGAALLFAGCRLLPHWCDPVLLLTSLNLFCTSALAAALLLGASQFSWVISRPTLRFFGEISYGLYLVHMMAFRAFDNFHRWYFPQVPPYHLNFLVMLVRFAICGSIAVAVAFLSRRYFEARFLKWKDRLSV
jgi:peptidoglycan/LPS O-acetylase OafA/YrhL